MNTTENNKLIAEFMGVSPRVSPLDGHKFYSAIDLDNVGLPDEPTREEELAFHKEWNWLMPVIRRLNELVDIKKGEEGIVNGLIMGDIEYTYSHLVDCIKWYNNRKDIEDNMAHDFDREPNF